MRPRGGKFLIVLTAAFVALAAVLILVRERGQRNSAESAADLPVYNTLGDFSLTERSGRLISRGELEARVWIANFIFTRCGGPCPKMTAQMKKIETATAGTGVQLVSFSVDPDFDTPERLRFYAERFGADSSRWWFLTGDKAVIYGLSRQQFMLGVDEDPSGASQEAHQGIMHSTRFTLMDSESRIRGYYESTDSESVKNLIRDALALVPKPSSRQES